MIWDKPITADGCTATPEQMTEAWGDWIACGNLTRDGLVSALLRAGVQKFQWTTASRMLQKARRAGAIRFNGRVWELVEPRP